MRKILRSGAMVVSLVVGIGNVGCTNTNKEITYQPTQSKVLNDSDVVYQYMTRYEEYDYNYYEIYGDKYNKFITRDLELFFSEEIGIYETVDYIRGIDNKKMIEHNYNTGEEIVLNEIAEAREYVGCRTEYEYDYEQAIVFDDESIVHAYLRKEYREVEQVVIKILNMNSKEQEVLKIIEGRQRISFLGKLDDENIVVMYSSGMNRDTVEVINVNTKESKIVYQTFVWEDTLTEPYRTIKNGNLIRDIRIDNGEIILVNNYYENGVEIESKIVIVDRDGNIVNEYYASVDDEQLGQPSKTFEVDNKQFYKIWEIAKINDYVSVMIESGATLMYKIVGDKLVQVKMPYKFYENYNMREVSQMKLDKRYFVWLDSYDHNKMQNLTVFDTKKEKLYKWELIQEGDLGRYDISFANIDYNNKMNIVMTDELGKVWEDWESVEVIVDMNELVLK